MYAFKSNLDTLTLNLVIILSKQKNMCSYVYLFLRKGFPREPIALIINEYRDVVKIIPDKPYLYKLTWILTKNCFLYKGIF